MEEPYVDTQLFEANRKTSNQFLGGNNSNPFHWTNDCGAGVKLDIGDKISVHSSYISEIGNESATIEIKGIDAVNNLNVGQLYSSSDTTVTKKFNDPKIGDMVFEYTQTTQVNQIRDDEINLTHSYYKTNNGDFYITLPRKCAWTLENNTGLPPVAPATKVSPPPGWTDDATALWNEYNSESNGSVIAPNPFRFEKDYSFVNYYGASGVTASTQGTPLDASGTIRTSRREIANDGSRFTLWVKQKTKNNEGEGIFAGRLNQTRDPALFEYLWYKRTHKYKVENGFNSPVNLAESITNQMADVRSITNFRSEISSENDTLNRNFDITAESRLNEAFPCATGIGFEFNNADNYLKYYNEHNQQDTIALLTTVYPPSVQKGYNQLEYDVTVTPLALDIKVGMFISVRLGSVFGMPPGSKVIYRARNGNTLKIFFDHNLLASEVAAGVTPTTLIYSWEYENKYDFLYESCYATIGFKRPELQEKGRFVNDKLGFGDRTDHTIDGSFLNRTIHHYPLSSASNSRPNHIITNLKWKDSNFLILKEFFDQQTLYPELFTFKDMSASQQGLLGPLGVFTGQGNDLSINTSRYIHMNTKTTPQRAASINGSMGGLATQTIDVTLTEYNSLRVGMMLYEQSAEVFPNKFTNAYLDERTYIVAKLPANAVHNNQIKVNNLGVVHAGTPTLTFTNNKLGDDQYLPKSAEFNFSMYESGGLFMDFNESRSNLNEGFGETTDPWETLRYGIFSRYREDSEQNPDPEKQYIAFYFGKSRNGVGQTYFENDAVPPVVVEMPDQSRCIGFDKHFNSYSNATLMLYNGLCGKYGNNFNFNTNPPQEYHSYGNRNNTFQALTKVSPAGMERIGSEGSTEAGTGADPSGFNDNEYQNQLYMGANDPSLTFDSNQSRFQFTRLHTPELVGTNASQVTSGSNIADAIAPCYKINKRLSRLNWSPTFVPYTNPLLNAFVSQGNASKQDINLLDPNIIPYSIMDAQSGIFIEDYGVDENNWRKSLWELLGFTYTQFHTDTDNRLARTFNLGLTTSKATTNGEVNTADLVNFSRELAIPTKQSEEIPYPQFIPQEPTLTVSPSLSVPDAYGITGFQDFPTIVQNCSSVNITADNLPRKMMSPIYLIKSDIISPGFIGGPEGSSKLPVISVVPKDSGYGDYYTGGGGEIFTNTIPRTLQTITTTIVDADGTPSRVDDGSVIIYKIQKELASNKNVIQNIFNPPPK